MQPVVYRFVMNFPRMAVAVTLTSALVLSACTGADTTDGGTTGSTSGTMSADGAATTATGEDAAATSADDAAQTGAATAGATDDASATSAMTTDAEQAAMSVDEAETVAADVLDARLAALKANGKKARRARAAAFAGSARTAAAGADRTEKVFGRSPESKAKKAAEPNVLAISREDGKSPVVLLVQTVPQKKKAPVLHLMESRSGEPEDFRITWEATMLPGTELPTFDRRSVGTPVLRKGAGDLASAPGKTLKHLAASLTWPRDENTTEYRTHGYGPAVRRANNSQAAAVADQATLRERNRLVDDRTRTLLFEDGSAFITGTIRRDTTFTVKDNSVLNPPESFRVFVNDAELTDKAVLRTTVMVGMRAPAKGEKFKPEMIAAREQLVDAWGS
jgi:hypothetical protein